jgi:hypothetical protein
MVSRDKTTNVTFNIAEKLACSTYIFYFKVHVSKSRLPTGLIHPSYEFSCGQLFWQLLLFC